ncbi:hypothetical protein GCM10023310_70230 [Paenibacillus vulneris]|uniref:Uncharacterized protein n=1 Tax=Paenibacillus vulneris TaxID=1133364 RepID=A0ABW3UJ34_9BACL
MFVKAKKTILNGAGAYTLGKCYEVIQEGRRALITSDDNGSKQLLDYAPIHRVTDDKWVNEHFEIIQ